MAIKLALELALQEARGLRFNPHVDVTISSDSKYAIGCMNEWISKWYNNGWVNSAGNAVANRDLIEKASDLEDELAELGRVKYVWIPREQNTVADRLCNEKMDDMRREDRRYESDESSDYY
jgi:ribonuclease HI